MSDRWRASVVTVGGQPVAAMDVEIRRTLFIDPQLFERLSVAQNEASLLGAGLSAAEDFIRVIQTVPEDTRRFYVEPWQDADDGHINMKPFAAIMQLIEETNFVRVIGDASGGFSALLYVGGIERRYDLSRASIPAFQAKLQQEQTAAQEAAKRGDITQDQADAIDFLCRELGNKSVACEAMYDAHARMLAEKDRQRREQEARDLGDRERSENGSASDRGPRLSDSFSGLR